MLKLLFSKAGGYIAAGLAALVAILAALSRAKKAGKDEVIAAKAKKEVENVKEAQKVERDVATRRPDDVRERLRDKFGRD
jgi:crotonobetainyl-CoA:carnitine CoA-transferase CaiB-like acyl-CoA transferase